MYDLATRKHALALVRQGHSLNAVSRRTGISRSAIRSWQHRLLPRGPEALCSLCGPARQPPGDRAAYAYLLGLYLGDGCISAGLRAYALRIACADAWPGLIEECARAIGAVRPLNKVLRVPRQGCVMVTAYSKHWPCLFPQHGPGKKHERAIVLAPWQREIVDGSRWEFVRGLVHSDGCRVTNWTTRVVAGERKRYEYPRYFFTNTSADIMRLYTGTLDALGVEWKDLRQSRAARTVSVARRGSVALMDRFVGAKH